MYSLLDMFRVHTPIIRSIRYLSCSIWFSAPSFWIGGGLDSRCVGRVCGADVAVRHPHRTPGHHFPVHTAYCVSTHDCYLHIGFPAQKQPGNLFMEIMAIFLFTE